MALEAYESSTTYAACSTWLQEPSVLDCKGDGQIYDLAATRGAAVAFRLRLSSRYRTPYRNTSRPAQPRPTRQGLSTQLEAGISRTHQRKPTQQTLRYTDYESARIAATVERAEDHVGPMHGRSPTDQESPDRQLGPKSKAQRRLTTFSSS